MKVPFGYCHNLWDSKLQIGPQHILHPTAHDDWEGPGNKMPKDIQFLIRERLERVQNENWGIWNWSIQIDYMECRNCDYGTVVTSARNNGLVHMPVINHVTVINLKE